MANTTKKYIITAIEDGRIIAMGEQLSVQENGNWWLKDSNTAYPNTICYAYDADGKIDNTENPDVIGKPVSVPVAVEPEKWCYDGDKFTENPNYEEPMMPEE